MKRRHKPRFILFSRGSCMQERRSEKIGWLESGN
jgi:hypothetical protein